MSKFVEVGQKLAVISDVHGNMLALEAVLEDIKRREADCIINLGDCVTSPLWPRETYEMLKPLGIPTVRGNHDRALGAANPSALSPAGQFTYNALHPSQRHDLAALPAQIEMSDGILAVHGNLESDETYLIDEVVDGRFMPASRQVLVERLKRRGTARVILCGHSHIQGLRVGPGECLILNPGSVGCAVFADRPTARTAEYRSPHARYALLSRRYGKWEAEMLAIAYDWGRTAERARENGRPDWAEAIATGTMGGH